MNQSKLVDNDYCHSFCNFIPRSQKCSLIYTLTEAQSIDMYSQHGSTADAAALDPWVRNGSSKPSPPRRAAQSSNAHSQQGSTSEGWRQNGWQEKNGQGMTGGNKT